MLGDLLRYALAFLITGGIATATGLAWWKFASLLGHDHWWYCLFAAGVVGFGARLAYGGRRGCALLPLGALMGAYTVLLHHFMFVQDDIRSSTAAARALDQMPLAERWIPVLQTTFQSLTAYGWVLVAGGAFVSGLLPFLARPFAPPPPPRGTKPQPQPEVERAPPGSDQARG